MAQHTGVEPSADAGQTQETQATTEPTYDDLFGETTGVDDELGDAGQATDEDDVGQRQDAGEDEDSQFDERTEKAFAKRLAAAEAKMRREYEEKYGTTPPDEGTQHHHQQPGYRQPLSTQGPEFEQAVEQLAERLVITPEAARAMLYQELRIQENDAKVAQMLDRTARTEAKANVEVLRAQNPNLPAFDERKLEAFRRQYHQRTGLVLPWEDTYGQYLAQEAMSGKLFASVEQQTEQRTIANITKRDSATVQAGKAGSAKRVVDINALPKEDFERIVELGKQGKLKKS